jgi:hypothetical protein
MASDSLALSGAIKIDGLGDMMRLADTLAKAEGFVPRHLTGKPHAIAAVILTGLELGIGPMEAMRSLHIVEGKPTMSAEYMLSRARARGVKTRWVETTDKVARLAVTVPGDTEPQTMAFTWEDAQRIGVASKDNWRKYPAAMLRARCISAAMRAFCPEVLGGAYESTSGELTDGDVPTVRVEAGAPAAATSAPALPAESPASQLDREIEAIRADLESATAREHIDAARGRAKLIGRKLSPEHRATLAAAAEAAELRLRQLEATSTVDAEEVV